MAPPGGDPDKDPPEILEVYPPSGTVNFTDDYFEFTFSEYVDKRSVKESIFISPEIEADLDYSWSGTSLEVSFEDSLKKNTTYTVTVGTDVADINNRNKMSEAFTFTFSTGAKIDVGEIAGKVYDDDPSGVVVGAYRIDEKEFDPVKFKPDYISQVGKNGKYRFLGLSSSKFRIAALRDEFRDYLYNVEEDQYGVLFKDVVLSDTNYLEFGMDFMLTKEDTTAPNVLSVTMTDKYHLLIEFSEFVDSAKLAAENFSIVDSTSNQIINVQQVFKGVAKPKQIFAALKDSLNENGELFLEVKNLYDNAGNVQQYQSTRFVVNNNPDTTAPGLRGIITTLPESKLDLVNPNFIISFNDGVDTVNAKRAMGFFDSKNLPIPLSVSFFDNSTCTVRIKKELESNSSYEIRIDLNRVIDLAGNYLDSTYVEEIKTINQLNFSGVTGKIMITSVTSPLVIYLISAEKGKKIYTQTANENFEYNLQRVQPGKYLIWCFEDADSNNVYSYGSLMPFQPSEKFSFYPDTLNLRARWPVGDVTIRF